MPECPSHVQEPEVKTPPIQPALLTETAITQPAEFVKIEKSLNSLGFFTPARRKGRRSREVRTITYPTREVNGTRLTQKATIVPSREHGQPTTADRDKYMAFMKIVTERRARFGEVSNPLAFTTYELLRYLGLTDSGTNFREVNQWIDRMVSTTIRSENAVYLNKSKRYAIDIFHVFDRAVLAGQQLEDGSIAQVNYIYLSQWQLDNINTNFVLPLDLQSYLELRRDVAKALFGHLHTWFFASRGARVETRYSYLCELLDIQRWMHLSRIKQALGPALDELVGIEYLDRWSIEATLDKSDYKLILHAGRKLLLFTRPRLAAAVPRNGGVDPALEATVKALVVRGVREEMARRLLLDTPAEQCVMDQIEYFDDQLRRLRPALLNPPGFLVTMIRENWPVPADFPTTRKTELRRRAQEAARNDPRARAETERELRRLELAEKYQAWVEQRSNAAVQARYPGAALEERLRKVKKEILARYPELYAKVRNGGAHNAYPPLEYHARRELAREVAETLGLPSFEEYCENLQPNLF